MIPDNNSFPYSLIIQKDNSIAMIIQKNVAIVAKRAFVLGCFR
jgi:hypothetical protein